MNAEPGNVGPDNNAVPDNDVLRPWLYVPMPDTPHPATWAALPDGPMREHTARRAAAMYRALVAVADTVVRDLDEGAGRAWKRLDGATEVWAATSHAYRAARVMAAEAAAAWQTLADRGHA